MLANTNTPFDIFGNNIRYVVPLFQRPYVWNQDLQWQPLWEDISGLAERLLESQGMPGLTVSPHFLGAIVLDQQFTATKYIGVRHVVDGQQRLTTLQILLHACQGVVAELGTTIDSKALAVLVLNDPDIAHDPDEVFKVWPTDRDQDAFREAMRNPGDVPAELRSSPIVKAHTYFTQQAREWALEGPQGPADRLNALVAALREKVKIVVIDLEAGDNAQVIFETLNHRGAPLLAADLIKNLVFASVAASNGDVQGLYDKYWRTLDTDYWRLPVAQGRKLRPRIDTFMNYWLTMRLLGDVPNDRVFADFRDHFTKDAQDINTLLADLAHDAGVYAGLEQLPADSVEGRFYYRILRAMDTGAVGPVLLWLLRHSEAELPLEQRHRALRALESWVVRRALCGATAKGVNLLVIEMLRELDRNDPAIAGQVLEAFLAGQGADARLWPTDEQLVATLAKRNLYAGLTRPRLRMILEAVEEHAQSAMSEGQLCPRNLTVEHIMPRHWTEHWDDLDNDPAAASRRDDLVQTLGNLTLVNAKLNPGMSNRPWIDPIPGGHKGKFDYLLKHSQLTLNATVVAEHTSAWTEDDITARTAELTAVVLELWPRPMPDDNAGAPLLLVQEQPVEDGAVLDSGDLVDEDDSSAAIGLYQGLRDWLAIHQQDELPMTFTEVEQTMGHPLPRSAYLYTPPWYGYVGTALGRAIRDTGWRAADVNLTAQTVTFRRAQ